MVSKSAAHLFQTRGYLNAPARRKWPDCNRFSRKSARKFARRVIVGAEALHQRGSVRWRLRRFPSRALESDLHADAKLTKDTFHEAPLRRATGRHGLRETRTTLRWCEPWKLFLASLDSTIKQLRRDAPESFDKEAASRLRHELLSKIPRSYVVVSQRILRHLSSEERSLLISLLRRFLLGLEHSDEGLSRPGHREKDEEPR